MVRKALCALLVMGWIPTLAFVGGARWITGTSTFAQGRTPIKVTLLYTAPDGKTKDEEYELPLTPQGRGTELSPKMSRVVTPISAPYVGTPGWKRIHPGKPDELSVGAYAARRNDSRTGSGTWTGNRRRARSASREYWPAPVMTRVVALAASMSTNS